MKDRLLDLAIAYHNGNGVAQSDKEAVKWLNKSADQGRMDFESKGADADGEDEDADLNYGDAAVKILFGHHHNKKEQQPGVPTDVPSGGDFDMPDER